MVIITVVLRDDEAKRNDTAKHIYTYNSSIIPRIGEFIEVAGHKSYEVDRVIHKLTNGHASVIIEVK